MMVGIVVGVILVIALFSVAIYGGSLLLKPRTAPPMATSDIAKYYSVQMGASPMIEAEENSQSYGTAQMVLYNNKTIALTSITWNLIGNDMLSLTNNLVGVHLHVGTSAENGKILLGFCGQDPLPPFGTPATACTQVSSTTVGFGGDDTVKGPLGNLFASACDIMGQQSPCYDPTGKQTIEDVWNTLYEGTLDTYLNIHTTDSVNANGNAGPLGLIRGQLQQRQPIGFYTASMARNAVADADTTSTGATDLVLFDDYTMDLTSVQWTLRVADVLNFPTNNIIGVHIHMGAANVNGPILYGFCGGNPPVPSSIKPTLPMFGAPAVTCPQYNNFNRQGGYAGSACNLGDGSPCYNPETKGQGGNMSPLDAFKVMVQDPLPDMYINLHTTMSFNTYPTPVGLIRGQLMVTPNMRRAVRVFTVSLAPQSGSSESNSTSYGSARIALFDDKTIALTSVNWTMSASDTLSMSNEVIGLHIHQGMSTSPGDTPIVYGFCGSQPLPNFGACPQDNNLVSSETLFGSVCNTGDSPCAQGISNMAAAYDFMMGDPPVSMILHTSASWKRNNYEPLGLIRGQLVRVM
jgi:predicted DNA-binding protein with PD1-like motif